MRELFSALAISASLWGTAQQVKIQKLLEDNISIRAISIDGNKVWYSGTQSKIGYVSLNDSLDRKQTVMNTEKKLDFRALTHNSHHLFAVNTQGPCEVLKINKKDFSYKVVFSDPSPDAFYDAIITKNQDEILALADPQAQSPKLIYSHNQGENFSPIAQDILPKLQADESHFAASNSNIFWHKNSIKIITGGAKSSLITSEDNAKTWQIQPLPIIQGSKTQGAYSQDYQGQFGIIVGGDYTKQAENFNSIITTHDGGKSWQVQANNQNPGYRTCVKIKPGSKGQEIIAIGDANISYSKDFGQTWQIISEEKGLYTLQWIKDKELVAAGYQRIIKITLID